MKISMMYQLRMADVNRTLGCNCQHKVIFAAFIVANIDKAGDMDMDCGVCENKWQDFRRGLERPC